MLAKSEDNQTNQIFLTRSSHVCMHLFTSNDIVTALSDYHAQFLIIANQADIDFEKQHHLTVPSQDFSLIERNKINYNQKSI